MSRFLAVLTSDPSLLRCQLHRTRRCFSIAEGEAVGLGSFGDDDVLLARHPPAADSRSLVELAAGIDSPAVLAVARQTCSRFDEGSIGPFRYRRWILAVVGEEEVEGFDLCRAALAASLPSFISRRIRGILAREHVFALFLGELHRMGALDDPNLPAEEATRALARSIRTLDEYCREAGATKPAPLLAAATNGRVMVAARRGLPLYYSLLEGSRDCARCALEEAAPADDPRVRPHRRVKSVILSSQPEGQEGLIEVPDASTVAVGRSLEITVASL